jgi:large subunit ribosomal protein L6
MSRVGKKPIEIPSGVTVTASGGPAGTRVLVKGPKGELEFTSHPKVKVEVKGKTVEVARSTDDDSDRLARALHGTTRALVQNMVQGVTAGFSRKLEIQGVGYQAKIQGPEVILLVGFSHPVHVKIPAGIKAECPQPTAIVISGIDKQKVGHLAATIRKVRPPEPYKGKGIRYEGEQIKRKAGKAFSSAT